MYECVYLASNWCIRQNDITTATWGPWAWHEKRCLMTDPTKKTWWRIWFFHTKNEFFTWLALEAWERGDGITSLNLRQSRLCYWHWLHRLFFGCYLLKHFFTWSPVDGDFSTARLNKHKLPSSNDGRLAKAKGRRPRNKNNFMGVASANSAATRVSTSVWPTCFNVDWASSAKENENGPPLPPEFECLDGLIFWWWRPPSGLSLFESCRCHSYPKTRIIKTSFSINNTNTIHD